MKKNMRVLLSVILPLLLLVSCQEESDITSDFTAEVSFVTGRIVDKTSGSFQITSNRDYRITSCTLQDEKDIDISEINDKEFINWSQVYGAGTCQFNIPGSAINVSEKHKGKLTLTLEEASSGAVREISTSYRALKSFSFTLGLDRDIYLLDSPMTISIRRTNDAATFIISKIESDIYNDIAKVVETGKTYEFVGNECQFYIPRISRNIENQNLKGSELNITILDESGCEHVLSKEFTLIKCFTKIGGSGSVSMRQLTEVDVNTPGGITLSCKEGDNILFGATTENIRNQSVSSEGSTKLYLQGNKPGQATIVIHPNDAGDSDEADIEEIVWVKPQAYLLIGGNFTYDESKAGYGNTRNYATYSSHAWYSNSDNFNSSHFNISFYNDKISGGWVGCPTSISSKLLYAEKAASSPEESKLSTELAMKGSLYGFAGGNGDNQYGYVSKSSLPVLDGVFSDAVAERLRDSRIDVSIKIDAIYGAGTGEYFLNYGEDMCYPYSSKSDSWPLQAGNSSAGTIGDFKSAHHKTLSPITPEKATFEYTNVPLLGSVLDEITVTNIEHSARVTDKKPKDGDRVYVYESDNTSSRQAKDFAPFKKSVLSTKKGDGLTLYLNRACDAVVLSGNTTTYQHGTGPTYGRYVRTSNRNTPAAQRIPTKWEKFNLSVSSLAYDTGLVDIIGIIYGFKVVDDAARDNDSNPFLCGGDYWWRKADRQPALVDLTTGNQSVQIITKK